ncbi:nucleopolyhedrovirus P10 family protein, partial [Streptomyces sp. PSKA30]|nr:nucleopolyhedrovirus P10 family protein [Streptomyces sp. PSKA30]
MTADGWTWAVRRQLGLGRLLPLGGPRDGAWITERAVEAVLRHAAGAVPGVRLGAVGISLADPEGAHEPAVPPPPSALPPGPLRVTAGFAATAAEPLPTAASRLRRALAAAASQR